jgi:hypothetical protein
MKHPEEAGVGFPEIPRSIKGQAEGLLFVRRRLKASPQNSRYRDSELGYDLLYRDFIALTDPDLHDQLPAWEWGILTIE